MDFVTYFRRQWDRASAIGCVLLGAVFLVVGWIGVSGSLLPAGQLPYIISGGLGGLFLLGLGAVLWLSADLRDEWRQLHEIAEALERSEAASEESPDQAVLAKANGSQSPAKTPRKPVEAKVAPRPQRRRSAQRPTVV